MFENLFEIIKSFKKSLGKKSLIKKVWLTPKVFIAHNGDPKNIKDVSCDMSPAFIKGVKKFLPDAEIAFDRFHIM